MARKQKTRQTPVKASEEVTATKSDQATAASLASGTASIYPKTAFQYIKNLHVQRGLQLVIVAAISSTVSQANLAPVYGSIPSSIYHRYGTIASIFLAFAIRRRLPPIVLRLVPTWAFWIPSIQFVLMTLSAQMGCTLGPLVTELLTYYPLLVLSFYVALDMFHHIQDPESGASEIADATPACVLFAIHSVVQRISRDWFARWVGTNILFTRMGMQIGAGLLYCMILPHSLFWPAFPSVVLTFLGNPHTPLARTTEIVNNTLSLDQFTLVDRRESISGYLSVLDSEKEGFRVMRCDHSLLGGEWLNPPAPNQGDPPRLVAEPIYAVFTMLEAIRLVDPAPASPLDQLKALNIGLGIGTAPAAMIQHGIKTTILELDPVVHEFAVKYFNLPHNHSYAHGDAAEWVDRFKGPRAGDFDYIIHDVFTGGAEPVPLFTSEFLSGLQQLLKDDGVIAINYAGDLGTPSASLVYRTIASIFGSCRIFREEPTPSKDESNDGDFTNMVFFCRKSGREPVKFRKAIEADFLGSGLRKAYMVPKHEIQASEFQTEGDILTKKNTALLEKYQTKSAVGHWKVMRTVLPDGVWENW
jgi:hypothetical protein